MDYNRLTVKLAHSLPAAARDHKAPFHLKVIKTLIAV